MRSTFLNLQGICNVIPIVEPSGQGSDTHVQGHGTCIQVQSSIWVVFSALQNLVNWLTSVDGQYTKKKAVKEAHITYGYHRTACIKYRECEREQPPHQPQVSRVPPNISLIVDLSHAVRTKVFNSRYKGLHYEWHRLTTHHTAQSSKYALLEQAHTNLHNSTKKKGTIYIYIHVHTNTI